MFYDVNANADLDLDPKMTGFHPVWDTILHVAVSKTIFSSVYLLY